MASLEDIKSQLMNASKGYHLDVIGELESKSWFTSPVYDLNRILSGSLYSSVPVTNHTGLVGPESCAFEDSFIPFEQWKGDKRQNHKGGTIKKLYKKFHKINEKEEHPYFWRDSSESQYYVKSINEENRVILNSIADVVYTGNQECIKLTTEEGKELICTRDHKIFMGNDEFKEAGDLEIGSEVYIHNNTRYKNGSPNKTKRYNEIFVKYHPLASKKVVAGYVYHRLKTCRAVLEADMNNMNFDEYRRFLNEMKNEDIDKLDFIPKEKEIHHIDRNHANDFKENLEILSSKEHSKKHAKENHNLLRFEVVSDTITNIEYVGNKETYDIKCFYPYNNYIVNGIVTHNSGKSSFMAIILADAQNKGYLPVIIDAEGSWNREFVERWGIDANNIIRVPNGWVDDIQVHLARWIDSGITNLAIALDSVGALEQRKVVEDGKSGNVKADQGRLQREIKRMLKMIVHITKFQNSISFSAGHYYGSPDSYGSPEQIGGGKYYRLSCDNLVTLRKSRIYENPNAKKKDEKGAVIGNKINAATLKNRNYPPFQEAVVEIDFQKGVNQLAGIIDLAKGMGLIDVSGSWFKCDALNIKAQGKEKFLEELKKVDKQPLLDDIEEILKTTGYSTADRSLEVSSPNSEADNTSKESDAEVQEMDDSTEEDDQIENDISNNS